MTIPSRFAIDLVPRLKVVGAARGGDLSGDTTSLDTPGHLHNPFFCAGRGSEDAICRDPPAQGGGKSRDIGKPHFTPRDRQRVQRSGWRPGTVALLFFHQDKLARVLAVELNWALRPPGARQAGAEQQSQSQPSQHAVLPRRFRWQRTKSSAP